MFADTVAVFSPTVTIAFYKSVPVIVILCPFVNVVDAGISIILAPVSR